MMKKFKISLSDVVPFLAFIAIFAYFTIASDGRMLSAYNLRMILDQSMTTILIGCGVLFVVAQGSIDLSVGVNLALSGVVATWVAHVTGAPFLLIPVAVLVGLLIGLIWAFGGSRRVSRQKLAQAYLLFILIAAAVAAACIFLFSSFLAPQMEKALTALLELIK